MLWFIVLCLVALVVLLVWATKTKKLTFKYHRVVRDGVVMRWAGVDVCDRTVLLAWGRWRPARK